MMENTWFNPVLWYSNLPSGANCKLNCKLIRNYQQLIVFLAFLGFEIAHRSRPKMMRNVFSVCQSARRGAGAAKVFRVIRLLRMLKLIRLFRASRILQRCRSVTSYSKNRDANILDGFAAMLSQLLLHTSVFCLNCFLNLVIVSHITLLRFPGILEDSDQICGEAF